MECWCERVVHDVVKLCITLLTLAVIVFAVGSLISEYLAAFKPGSAAGQGQPATGVVYGGTYGRSSATVLPKPTAPYGRGMMPVAQYPYGVQVAQPMPPAGAEPAFDNMNLQPMFIPSPTPAPTAKPVQGKPAGASPFIAGWYDVIQKLTQLLPMIFTGHSYFPSWPTWSVFRW